MDKQLCPQCGEEMKLIPAGISRKTGEPYEAFFSCKACGYTMNIPNDIAKNLPTQPSKQGRIDQAIKEKNERIERLHNDTSENINWDLSWKLATEIVTHHPLYAAETEKQIEESIEILQKWFYPRITQQVIKPSQIKDSMEESENNEEFDEFLTQPED